MMMHSVAYGPLYSLLSKLSYLSHYMLCTEEIACDQPEQFFADARGIDEYHCAQGGLFISMDLIEMGRKEEGIKLFEHLLSLHKFNYFMWMTLGQCHTMSQQNEEAERAFSRSIELAFDVDPEAYWSILNIYRDDAGYDQKTEELNNLAQQKAITDRPLQVLNGIFCMLRHYRDLFNEPNKDSPEWEERWMQADYDIQTLNYIPYISIEDRCFPPETRFASSLKRNLKHLNRCAAFSDCSIHCEE